MIILRLLLVLALTITPSMVLAQDSASEADEAMPLVDFPDPPPFEWDGELQFWLAEGKRAPYAGVHLNVEGISHILTEYEAQKARGELALKKQRDSDFATLQLETGKLKVQLEAEKSKSAIKESASADEKKRLLAINEDLRDAQSDFWGDLLKIGGGVALGAAVVAVLAFTNGGEK